MRKASWLLTLALAAVWLAFAPLSKPVFDSHVITRFSQGAQVETGFSQPFLAVLGDYRAFDVFVLCLLFFGVLLSCLIPSLFQVPVAPMKAKARAGVLLILVGLGLALGMGFYCLSHGSNLLDFEALAGLFPSETARHNGALLLGAAFLLSLLGSLLSFGTKETPMEDSHGH